MFGKLFMILAASLFTTFVILCNAVQSSHRVEQLPGQPSSGFKHYAGYITVTVDAAAGRHLFYWLYQAPTNSSSLPLVLWLNGGPGCSSIGFGALAEMGPFRVNASATGLTSHQHAWNKVSNLLFLETPYGVGFSYSDTPEDEVNYSNNQTASDNLVFLVNWLTKFPEFGDNELYLSGESYAGQYVPTLASHIVSYNKRTTGSRINLKGFALGNPFTSSYYETGYTLKFLYTHSLIPREAYEAELDNCYVTKPGNWSKCATALKAVDKLTELVDPFNIYGPSCTTSKVRRFNRLRPGKGLGRYDPCVDLVTPYLNLPEVQTALNVRDRNITWRHRSDKVFFNFQEGDPDSRGSFSEPV